MCTMIVEKVKIAGSGKGASGWFKLEQANVSYDHPFDAPLEHALNIDFVNESQGPVARVAVELSEQAAVIWFEPFLPCWNKPKPVDILTRETAPTSPSPPGTRTLWDDFRG